jgi:hypothetical protein
MRDGSPQTQALSAGFWFGRRNMFIAIYCVVMLATAVSFGYTQGYDVGVEDAMPALISIIFWPITVCIAVGQYFNSRR